MTNKKTAKKAAKKRSSSEGLGAPIEPNYKSARTGKPGKNPEGY